MAGGIGFLGARVLSAVCEQYLPHPPVSSLLVCVFARWDILQVTKLAGAVLGLEVGEVVDLAAVSSCAIMFEVLDQLWGFRFPSSSFGFVSLPLFPGA